jgi:hypothetical protein
VTANTQEETQVDTESSDVCTSFARDPENSQLPVVVEFQQLALVNGSDTQLSLDSRDERGSLEKGAGKSLERTRELCLAARELVVQSQDSHIFFTRTLLTLHKSCSAIDTDDQTTRDLGIECAGVTSTVNTENALEPCDDFVRGGVRRLVEVDDTGGDVGLEITAKRGASCRDGREVTGPDQH